MKRKRIIRKILVLSAWTLVLTGMTILLVAANRKQKEHLCHEVLVSLKGESEKFYIEKEDISKLLLTEAKIIGRPVTSINLAALEQMLEKNDWIRNAELYFDSRDALHVFVEEREPVARVFTVSGRSFYIDSAAHPMPLIEKMSARVPVLTGYPDRIRRNAPDSLLVRSVKSIASFIGSEKFWNAQIGQIDITPERKFELIPVVGDHVIRIGTADDLQQKFRNLQVFYAQVLSKTGFDRYQALDLSFRGQVVAIQKGPASAIDSIQLKKNIEELVNRASMQNIEESMLPSTSDSSAVAPPLSQSNPVQTPPNPNPQQTVGKPNAAVKTNPSKAQENQPVKRTPKAVMKKRNG